MTNTNRYFARCTGCLTITAIEAPAFPYGLICGICQSIVENMGRVKADRLVEDNQKCVCDDRCTCARGPICSCSCGGKNHGVGMLAGTIFYTTDKGPVPMIEAADETARTAALARYTEYKELRQQLRAEETVLYQRRQNREFLPRPDWDRMITLQRILNEVSKAKTHSSRMKKLRALLNPAAA